MRKKMTKDDLKNLFPPYDPTGRRTIEGATKRGYKHKHNPTYKPPKAKMSPADWKRKQRERRLKNAKRTTR